MLIRIELYKPGNTDYEHNGDMPLLPESASVKAILNGSWKAEIQHPIDEEGRWKWIEEDAVVKLESFNGTQLFRIKKKAKSDAGVSAELEPVFMDAIDDCFLLDIRPTEKNGQQALDIMTTPNKKYSGKSNIKIISTAYYQTKNLIEAICGEEENSFLNRWGGEVLFDNYTITVNDRVGIDHGVQVLYGKNIAENGLQEEIDTSEVITRIVPKAYNGYMIEGNEPWVDSPLLDKYPTIKYGVITFEDVKMKADAAEDDEENGIVICNTQEELNNALKEKCEEQFEAGIDKPKVTISADMVMLHDTELYADIRELEEELIANLRKSEFLVAMDRSEEDPAKVNIPYLKNKEGKILQPVFSDVLEYEKFARGKKLRIAKIPFVKLADIMIQQAEALVINPMGFNLILNREQLKKIIG